MSRRSPLFSLSALTRAYQRNLKAFARVTKPVRAAKPVRAKAVAVSRARPKAAPVARTPRKPLPASGEWLAGIAPGPAGARRFHLYVPPGLALRAGEKLPLLVMLHGCGQTGRELAASSRMNRLAVRHRFLVLYPEQERLANAHGCWNWFDRRSGKADAEAATLLAAIELVARRHPVDMARVAVAGLSAGASMAALLVARYPVRFCAVAMHSGVAPGKAHSAAAPRAGAGGGRAIPPLPPLLILHGDADNVVRVRNAAATAVLWAESLGARAGPVRTMQRGRRHAVRVTEYKARGRAQVTLREIVGLGHAWSGGAPGLNYSDPAGPDASALVWAFVARQFKKI